MRRTLETKTRTKWRFSSAIFIFSCLVGPVKKNTRLITNVGGKRCEYDQAIHVNLSQMPHGCCCSCCLADRPTDQPASARFESNQLTSTLLIPSEKSKETTKQQHLSVLFCFHTYWQNAAENKRKNSRATLHEE